MTQILNNMKRKEKKGLFYLIGIAIMVAIMGISCSESPTAPANFSETEDFIEAPAPEVKPEQTPTAPEFKITDDFSEMEDFIEVPAPEVKPEQTPIAPVLKIKANYGAGQFDGLIFENSTLRAEVKTITGYETILVLSDGREYGFGIPVAGPAGVYRLSPRDLTYSKAGTATFIEDGYLHLSIGGEDKQILKLVK